MLQASYLKILDGRARFAGRSSFRTFLFGVIRRTAAEERRRTAIARMFFGRSMPEESSGGESGPDERLAFRAALARLSRRQREVLELVLSGAAGEAHGDPEGHRKVTSRLVLAAALVNPAFANASKPAKSPDPD